MKVKSYWKIIAGVIVTLFLGATGNAKDTKTAQRGAQLQYRAGAEKVWWSHPSEGVVQLSQPQEGVSKKVTPEEVSGVVLKHPGERMSTISLPDLDNQRFLIVPNTDENATKYNNRPAVFMNDDGTGFLRIPIKKSDEEELMDEYKKSR